jgi:rhodanese-related sulfurtransferase
MKIEQLIKSTDTIIVDVRTPGEFLGGNVEGSVNIPLQELQSRIDEFRTMSGNIVLCCASGNRSGIAAQLLRQLGFDKVYNGGSWIDVNYCKCN